MKKQEVMNDASDGFALVAAASFNCFFHFIYYIVSLNCRKLSLSTKFAVVVRDFLSQTES